MRRPTKKIRMLMALAAVCALCFMMGCSGDYKADVESNTSWSGVFGGKSVSGSGNKTIDLPDEGRQCIQIQKNTASGFVKLKVYDASASTPGGNWKETTGPYGYLDYCWDF